MTKPAAHVAARPSKQAIHGWLILDKPEGISSAQAVGAVKRFLRPKKIGHAGTLDPLASGILPLALGEATKTVQFTMDASKSYRFTVRWGEQTTTDDREGEVMEHCDKRPSREDILAVLPSFIGEISQFPPIFSALKVNGKRAYDLARAGEAVELKARPVMIHDLQLLDCPDADHAVFEVNCGKGTYVRSLARDFGEKLGCLGYCSQLRRTRVGKFSESDAISLESLEEIGHNAHPFDGVFPVEAVLDDIPELRLEGELADKLRNGQVLQAVHCGAKPGEEISQIRVMDGSCLLAIGKIEHGLLRPVRVFNL